MEKEMNETVVKGFKVFNPDWTYGDKQYTCPGQFEEDTASLAFCKEAVDCFDYYYQFKPENKVAEVVAYGMIVENGNRCCTDKLKIIREIPWNELLEIVNKGKGCTGLCNIGDWNSGDYNIGICNSGNYNSGNWNSGDYNSGSWNKASFSNGCFNTAEPKIFLFNKPSEWTYYDWLESRACRLLAQIPYNTSQYIPFTNMTDEKAAHPEAETTGGYLKTSDNSEVVAIAWWRSLTNAQKDVITEIPNFDKDIFKEITGIDVDEK